MKKLVSVLLCVSLYGLSSQAANIAWISFNPADDTPNATAATVGFTESPDIGYTTLLSNNGHTVTRFVTASTFSFSQLVGFDLVIIGRAVSSGHYDNATQTAAWNSYAGKVMVMGGYVTRDNRLGFFAGNTILDTTGSITLQPTGFHPIFAGIPIDGQTGNMFNDYAGIVTHMAYGTNITARGISMVTSPLDGNPTVLATVGTASDPTFGAPVIALWDIGDTLTPDNNRTDVLGGYRMMFLSGSREPSGVTGGEVAGVFDLSADGSRLFLNTVDYFITVVPEPSSVVLLGLGGLALLLRRKQA